MRQKIEKIFFSFLENCIWRCCSKLSVLRTEYFLLKVNLVKVLSLSFQQFFDPFPMLLLEASSETRPFKHLLTTFFGVCKVKNTSARRVIFFFKMFKFESRFQKGGEKNAEKVLCFRNNYIWRCCNKMSLLRREYLSLTVSVFANSPEIFHITQRDFLQLNCPHSDQQIW